MALALDAGSRDIHWYVIDDRALSRAIMLRACSYPHPIQPCGSSAEELYELLTLQRPFHGADVTALQRAVCEQPPPQPRTLVDGLPADLEAICLKCLQKSQDRRYQSAAEFADDLRRWLRSEPTRARPARTLRRVALWSRRNPGWAVAIALCTAAVAALWSLQAAHAKAELTKAAAVRELELRESALQESTILRFVPRRAGWSGKARNLLLSAAQSERNSRLRDAAAACLAGADAQMSKVWKFASSSVTFSQDGKRLLIGGGIEGNTRIWDSELDTTLVSQQAGFGPVTFGADGNGLQWTAESPWSFVLWNVSRHEQVCRVRAPLPAGTEIPTDVEQIGQMFSRVSLAMSRDASLLATSVPYPDDKGGWINPRGGTFVWNNRGELLRTIDAPGSALCFSKENSLLAVGGYSGIIRVIDLQGQQPDITLRNGVKKIHALDFIIDPLQHEDGLHWLLAAGDAASGLRIWDLAERSAKSICRGSAYDVYAVQFSPDGMTLASGGREGARLWDCQSGELLLHVNGVADYITGLAFSADGTQLAVSAQGPADSNELTTSIWSVQHGRGINLLHGMLSQVVHTSLSPDGRILAALGQNWQIGVYDTSPPRLRYILQGPVGFTADNAALAISADNRSLAASAGSEARLWDLDTGHLVARHMLPPALVDQLAFTPDGKLLSFRCECQDGRTAPISNPQTHPRVLRLRNLLAQDPLEPLAETPRFNWHVFCAVAHPEGEFFIAEGLHVGPDSKSQEIIMFDGTTGVELWKHVPAVPNTSPSLTLDPTGGTLSDFDESQMGAAEWQLPSGRILLQRSPRARALAPFGESAVIDAPGRADDPAATGPGFALWRRDHKEPAAVLGIDFLVHELSPTFSRDGSILAFGTRNGQVVACDIREIERILTEFQEVPE